MKAKLQVRNVLEMVPAMPLSCIFSQMGGIVGAAEDATWRIQDTAGNIVDSAARITVIDGYFTIETLSGMPIFINGATAPIAPARPIILSDKDLLQIGDLTCLVSVGVETMSQTEVKSMSSFAMAANNTEDLMLIDGEYSEARQPELVSQHVSSIDPLKLLDQGTGKQRIIDPLDALDDSKARLDTPEERRLMGNVVDDIQGTLAQTIPDHTNAANASLLTRRVQRDRYGFEEATDDPVWETQSENPAPPRAEDAIDSASLESLARSLGLPKGSLNAANQSQTLDEIGGALRAAIRGLNTIYKSSDEQSQRFPISSMQLNAIEDNPLRTATHTDEVVQALFAEKKSLRMSPAAAVAEVTDHLEAHQTATEQATDLALSAVQDALSPDALETRFQSYATADTPTAGPEYDAWCWGMYKTYVSELKSRRQNGLQSLFWDVFQHEYQGIIRERDQYSIPAGEPE